MPEVTNNIIQESTQKDVEPTIEICKQILKDCKKDLDKFPSTGAHYFSFPEPPENLKTAIVNLPEQEIHNLISGWEKTDLKERLVDEYGDRTFGYFLTNLFAERADLIGKEVGNSAKELIKKSLIKPDEKTILKMHEMSKLQHYLPESDRENFTEYMENEMADLKNTHQNITYEEIIPYQLEGMEIIASLNIFKSGIIDNDLLYELNGQILLTINDKYLAPIEALYEKEKINENRDEDTLSSIALLAVIVEVMDGKEIDSEKLSFINKEESELLVPMLYVKLANIKAENLAPGVQKLIKETEITPKDAETILQGLIVTESKIDDTSFLYEKLQIQDLSQEDLGKSISTALNIYNGDWDKVNPLLRDIIEKSFLNKNLKRGEIIDILSATVALKCKLPDFLKLVFEKPENQETLLRSIFDFRISKPINKYGAKWCIYRGIEQKILKEGFSAFPEPVRTFYSKNLGNIEYEARKRLLGFVFPTSRGDLDFYNLISTTGDIVEKYDHKLYSLISQDVWDVLKTSSAKEISDFFRYSSNMIAGVIYYDGQEGADDKILIPIEYILPPDIIENLTKKMFPDWKIEKSSIKNLGILNFIITDKMLVNFSETDRNFLNFSKKYPEAGTALFDYKDRYFAEDTTEKKVVTSKMISDLIGKIPYKEIQTLTSVYMDINNDNLDFNFLKDAINHRFFPAERAMVYLKNNNEYYSIYQKLYEQSGSQEWVDLIPNKDNYWKNNSIILVNLLEMGFNDLDFDTFRMLNNNPNTIEILNDLNIKIESFTKLIDQISISPHNLSYLNLKSINLLDSFNLSENPKTQGFFRRLLSEQPRSFNNAVGALHNNRDIDFSSKETQEQIFSIINKIGNISPMVLKYYINEDDPYKKEEFILKIKTIRERFLLNEPVKNILSELGYGNEVLAELITLAFPGTNLRDVESQLTQLDDQCEDLKDFSINKGGYIPTIKQQFKTAILKDGENINNILLDDLKEMFPGGLNKQIRSEYKDQLTKSLIFALKTRGAFSFDELKESVPAILSIMYDEEPVQEFRKTNFDFSQPENVTTFLSRITELLGIYFKDNFENKLLETLEKNPELSNELQSRISKQFIDQAPKNMGKINNDQEKSTFQNTINNLSKNKEENTPISNQDISKLITFMLEHRILRGQKGLRAQIKKEYNKFNFTTTDKSSIINEAPQFKGFVSKNIASFFAKTSAGICTAGDTTLFRRKDHFHINLISNETVVGNIQGYIFEHQGQKSLLFRGFNPSVTFVNPNNADMVAEGMVSIVNQFALENSIPNVFIAEQTAWHSLTNRVGEGVLKYFQNNYIKKDREVEQTFPVTSNQNIDKMYRIN